MRKKKNIFGAMAILIVVSALSGCSSMMQASSSNRGAGDLYGVHDRDQMLREEGARAERLLAESNRRSVEMERQNAAARASVDSAVERLLASGSGNLDNILEDRTDYGYVEETQYYENIEVNDYETAYARRLRGFESPTYNMPASYFNARYSNNYALLSYDPTYYNVMVMGDQIWVEPKYITSMFGMWGSSYAISFGVGPAYWGYSNWGRPYWGSSWGWGWGWGGSYWGNPYWGYPYDYGWGYYPHHGHWHGGGHWGGDYYGDSNITYRPGSGSSSSGSSRPGSGSSSGSYRPGGSSSGSYKPGNGNTSGSYRPGGSTSGSYRPGGTVSGSGNTSGSYRPGTSTGSSKPSTGNVGSGSSGSYRPGTSTGSSKPSTGNVGSGSSGSYKPSGGSSSSSSGSSSGSSGSYRPSGGSSSSSSGSSGGGSSSGRGSSGSYRPGGR